MESQSEVKQMTQEMKINHIKSAIIALQAEYVQYMQQYTSRLTMLKEELKRVKDGEQRDD